MSDILSPLAYLNGQPTATAKLKAKAADFVVIEDLGFEFTGTGEHLMVRIRKTGENTSFVANELAKACGVKSKDISWAGLKDRHAVTEQWLSVHLPQGGTPDFSEFLAQYPSIEILGTARHNKKLRPGDLIGNQFEITLSEVSDTADVARRLDIISKVGVPNYYGAQRFGNKGNNLNEARRWGRENVRTRNQNQRSLYLSAARSWIFNLILSERIEQQLFSEAVEGDIVLVNGRHLAVTQDNLQDVNQQMAEAQVEMSIALAGDNALPTSGKALEIEQKHLDSEPDLMALICGNRMRHDRRAASLMPINLSWKVLDDNVILNFSLDSGCFATAIIRELVEEVYVERHYD